jgi:hypothetical protein
MKIADLPADHRRSRGIASEGDLENGLGRLRDHVAFAALAVKNRSIGESMIKIKPKFPSILSDSPPPTLCQRYPIRKQENDFFIAVGCIVIN